LAGPRSAALTSLTTVLISLRTAATILRTGPLGLALTGAGSHHIRSPHATNLLLITVF
jgi:hypothetical protein